MDIEGQKNSKWNDSENQKFNMNKLKNPLFRFEQRIFYCIFVALLINKQEYGKSYIKESVKRGNAAMIHGGNRGVSVDAHNVSVRCRTVTGVYTMTFPVRRLYLKLIRLSLK